MYYVYTLVHTATMSTICNGTTQKTFRKCTNKGKFVFGDHTYCGMHVPNKINSSSSVCKNSLRSRMSSTQYACAITVFKSFEPLIEKNSVVSTNNDDTFTNSDVACFYCDCDLTVVNKGRAMDHMLPVIVNKKPNTKYFRAHNNTVHCCIPCNTSKGNRPVIAWMSAHTNPLINNPEKIRKATQQIASIPDVPSDIYAHMLSLFDAFMANHEHQIQLLERSVFI